MERRMRATVLVIDSYGIGEMPDADTYGDAGANTALHIAQSVEEPDLPNLRKLGLGNAASLLGVDLPGASAQASPLASFSVMEEASKGKDTITGHWELAGMPLQEDFGYFNADYPSFPESLLGEFEKQTNRKVIGNISASGTEIIQELGAEHLETGALICYTSADSVFQIAAHEDVVTVEELYRYCVIARKLCDPLRIARVIARPFTGDAQSGFTRTKNRKDFSIALPSKSIFDHLQSRSVRTLAVGKIGDIFNEQGIDDSYHDKGNPACLDRTVDILSKTSQDNEFVFVNLVDTDMIYGHRRDPQGYFAAVKKIDDRLQDILDLMQDDDVLVITADHGCDPTHPGTDHTREHVPLLWYQKGRDARSLGIRKSFADLAASLSKYFETGEFGPGRSFI
jgi:phosphopentomutase